MSPNMHPIYRVLCTLLIRINLHTWFLFGINSFLRKYPLCTPVLTHSNWMPRRGWLLRATVDLSFFFFSLGVGKRREVTKPICSSVRIPNIPLPIETMVGRIFAGLSWQARYSRYSFDNRGKSTIRFPSHPPLTFATFFLSKASSVELIFSFYPSKFPLFPC